MTNQQIVSIQEPDTTVCQKRTYPSPYQAKVAHAKASWRVRVYQCEDCGGWHVTNHEKKV
jgi:hypothetical protein